jgi:hypothetical protein
MKKYAQVCDKCGKVRNLSQAQYSKIKLKQSSGLCKKCCINSGRFKAGVSIKKSEEHKRKIGIANKRTDNKKRGENHYNWRGGKTFEEYSVSWTKSLKISIRERDRYCCRLCGEKQDDISHCVHHIDYNKKNCNPDNLITLCFFCHSKTNFNREYWSDKLNKLNGME